MQSSTADQLDRPADAAPDPGRDREPRERVVSYRFGPFCFQRTTGILLRDDEELYLPPRAIGVLELLLERAGEVVSKDDLVAAVWHDAAVTDQSPSEAIGVIREVLDDDSHEPTYIQTVYRRGYRFIAEVTAVRSPESASVDAKPRADSAAAEEAPGVHIDLPRRVLWATVAGLLGILTGALLYAAWFGGAQPGRDLPPLQVPLALPLPIVPSTPPSIALSPDGGSLVYRAGPPGGERLHVMSLEGFESEAIPGTEGGYGPFFSPDGGWIGYFTDGRLMKLSIRGGPPVPVAETAETAVYGATWREDGMIVFSQGARSQLMAVAASGGSPEVLASPDAGRGQYSYRWPAFLPGGDSLLFSIEPVGMTSSEDLSLARLSLRTGEAQTIFERGGIQPRFLGSGHVTFARGGTLFALPFDPAGTGASGPAIPVFDNLMMFQSGAAQYGIATTGRLVYVSGEVARSRLAWIDRAGETRPVALDPGDLGRHRVSPDGSRIALAIDGDIWIYSLDRETLTRFTSHRASELLPLWSPTGDRIVFSSNRRGPYELFVKRVGGLEPEEPLLEGDVTRLAESWSPDGRWLAFSEVHPETGQDLWLLSMEAAPRDGEAPRITPLLRTPFQESQATFSPEGDLVAFASNETGHYEVYVAPFDDPGAKLQVSRRGGRMPQWSPSGEELFFNRGDELHVVRLRGGDPLQAAAPELVLEVPDATSFYTVGPDGRSFLVGQRQEPLRPEKVHLISDVTALLSRDGSR